MPEASLNLSVLCLAETHMLGIQAQKQPIKEAKSSGFEKRVQTYSMNDGSIVGFFCCSLPLSRSNSMDWQVEYTNAAAIVAFE